MTEEGDLNEDFLIDPTAESSSQNAHNGLASSEAKFFHIAKLKYDLEHAKHTSGWLGSFFGTGPSAAQNIAGTIAITCLFAMIALALLEKIFPETGSSDDYFKNLQSVLLASVGYLFGSYSKK